MNRQPFVDCWAARGKTVLICTKRDGTTANVTVASEGYWAREIKAGRTAKFLRENREYIDVRMS